MGNVLLTLPLARVVSFEAKRSMQLFSRNEQTGAEARMGHSGSGYYVEASHPAFALPLRKTYEWYQRDIAARDFDVLRAVVGAPVVQVEAKAS